LFMWVLIYYPILENYKSLLGRGRLISKTYPVIVREVFSLPKQSRILVMGLLRRKNKNAARNDGNLATYEATLRPEFFTMTRDSLSSV